MAVNKKKVIKSLENLTDDLKELISEQYPNGYESSITRITNAKKEPTLPVPIRMKSTVRVDCRSTRFHPTKIG